MKIVFFGTSHFALPALEMILRGPYEVKAVTTTPDKPAGRKHMLQESPVKTFARGKGILVLEPIKGEWEHFLENVQTADIFIVAAYGKIIPKSVLIFPSKGILNIHPSLLPRWRGPSPIQTAILHGDAKTGVTIHITTEKVDAGDILAAQEFGLSGRETYLELEDRLAELGAQLLEKTLPFWLDGAIPPRSQDERQATYSKMIRTEDGKIDWTHSVLEIDRQIRAFNPEPGTFCFWGRRRLLISRAELEQEQHGFALGRVVEDGASFKIAASDGFIKPNLFKLAGKKETAPTEFLRGNRKVIGTVLS